MNDRKLKTLLVALVASLALVACLALVSVRAADPNWQTDLPAAQAQAAKEKKLVLLNFTSSDSCLTCRKLKRDVFSQPAFLKYAKAHLILVEVDFPYQKQLSPEQQKANASLAEKYGIESYPTIVVLDGAGQKIGGLEEPPGNPKELIAAMEKLRK
jgi:protein disulfide-isomerase